MSLPDDEDQTDLTEVIPETVVAGQPPGSGVAPPVAPAAGANLRYGRYTVLPHPEKEKAPWELGRGGMGVTYKAEDPELRRAVVLKVILPTLFDHDPQARARFRREARAAAGIHHPHIATVFDIGEARGEDYYVMEFIDGETLQARLRRDGPLDVFTTLHLGRQVVEALDAAWEPRRIVHRDLKPANLMLARRPGGAAREAREGPLVKVVDFGLAKAIEAAGADGGSAVRTQTGMGVGTWAYSSPEQLDASKLGPPSDLYSLSVTLWECLTGTPTFGHPSSYRQALASHFNRPPPLDDLRAVGVPEPLVAFLARLLAKESCDRPATAQLALEEIEELRHTLAHTPPPGQTPPPFPVEPPPPPPPPTPTPIPAAVEDSFTLVEVLRERGVLPADETVRFLEILAPLVDAEWAAGALPDAEPGPGRVRVRFDPAPAPARLRELPAQPLDRWPPGTFLLDPADPSSPRGDATSIALGQTLPAPRSRVSVTPAGALAALGYELLGGQPPAPGRWRPLPALDEAGNDLLREALRADSRFRSAGELAAVLRRDPEVLPSAELPPSAPVPLAARRSTRKGWLLSGCIGVAVVGVLLLTMSRSERKPGPGRLAVSTPTPMGQPVQVLLAEAQRAWYAREYLRVVEVCDQALTLNFDLPLAYARRADANEKLNRGESVEADRRHAIALTPTDALGYFGRGVAYSDTKQPERAVIDFDKAIELDPEFAHAYNNRGSAYHDLRQFERAVADFDKAIELDPEFANAYVERGNAYYDLRQFERAVADYTEATNLDPKFALAYNNRSFAYRALGKITQADGDLAKAKELSGGQTP